MIDRHELEQVVNTYLPLFDFHVEYEEYETETDVGMKVTVDGKVYEFTEPKGNDAKQWKHFSKNAVYQALEEHTGHRQPWGSHTGVRPVSLVHQLGQQGQDAERVLREDYHFSQDKINLVMEIANIQQPLLNADPKAIDIYIGIPFCKSRCSYCSFSLVGIEKKGKLQRPYTECLCQEIREVGQDVLDKGYHPRCIYIGGGTPTALADEYLAQVLKAVNQTFPQRMEFTLEAGRPDTITESNLTLAKAAGVTRLSINPQTMHQRTLEKIGRRHSPQEIQAAMALARKIGFDNINMDIIAGLPGEAVEDFAQTLDWVIGMAPEAITVHTLALKRSSALKKQDYVVSSGEVARGMLEQAYERLDKTDYHPYYLYRQKYMEGSGENVGFSLPGKECRYNIDIMEENTHILAMGSGAVSKKLIKGGLIRRSDPKDVEVYLERLEDTILKNKTFF